MLRVRAVRNLLCMFSYCGVVNGGQNNLEHNIVIKEDGIIETIGV